MSYLEVFNPINGLVESLKARRKSGLNRRFGSEFENVFTDPEDERNFQIDSGFLEKCGAVEALSYAAAALQEIYPDAKFEGPLRPDKYLFHSTSVRITWDVKRGLNPFGYWSSKEVRCGALLLDKRLLRFTRDGFLASGDPSLGQLRFYAFQTNHRSGVAVEPNPEAINIQLAKSIQTPYRVAIYPPTLREVLTGRYPRTAHHLLP